MAVFISTFVFFPDTIFTKETRIISGTISSIEEDMYSLKTDNAEFSFFLSDNNDSELFKLNVGDEVFVEHSGRTDNKIIMSKKMG